ncbi:hypothetical protein FRB94_011052 [Tulasnella sp. JGI-2019a]|nr:hypothetical protein FRB93_009657 [Tulasnella sp. JGI-2019a]KAG8993123.1 hypothetical protein FRB94_011052 [Tulasnella sp. JGI-2019a]
MSYLCSVLRKKGQRYAMLAATVTGLRCGLPRVHGAARTRHIYRTASSSRLVYQACPPSPASCLFNSWPISQLIRISLPAPPIGMSIRKAADPHVVGGTKITLDILSTVADVAYSPDVNAVTRMVSQIITITEGLEVNPDYAKKLIERLLSLLLVLTNTYGDKNDGELSVDIRANMARLDRELDVMLEGLKQIQASTNPGGTGSSLDGSLLYIKNNQIVNGYTAETGWAMSVFQVENRIQDALRFQETYTDVEVTRINLENMQIVGLSPQDSLLIPSQPSRLLGGEGELNNVVGRITSTESSRLAILGPGGIGKTALLLAVREHTDVEQKFGDFRFFVPCEQATSITLLVELIAKSLHIENSSGDRMEDIRTRLRSSSYPTLLLLDSFETPWDIPEGHTRVEEILCSLALFPHVTILLTMRSNAPPSTNVPWSLPWIEPLPVLQKEAARDLYISIDPSAATDDSLDTLLSELSYMHLPITLMAGLGRTGEAPGALLQVWEDKTMGPDLLYSTDQTKCFNQSIRQSIESNLMRSVPEALTLLSAIAMLPTGADINLLPKLVPSIRDMALAQATLREAALTSADSDAPTLQLPLPIRAYVLKHYPLTSDLKGALYEVYAGLIANHGSQLGDVGFPNDVHALSVEEANLEALLPDAVRTGSGAVIDAAITFCWYQYYTRPRLEVIRSVVQACQQTRNLKPWARSAYCCGSLMESLGQFKQAWASYTEAGRVFDDLGDRLGAVQCLKARGRTHWMQDRFNEAHAVYIEAVLAYKELGDQLGAAQCLQELGDIDRARYRYEEARASYTEASGVFEELGDQLGAAHCLQGLGYIHQMQDRYDEARAAYTEAGRISRESGDRLGAAQCLKGLGDIHQLQRRFDKAEAAYAEANQESKELGDLLGAARCLQGLGHIHRMQGRYDEARTYFLEANGVFEAMGDRLGAVQCLEALGDVDLDQGRYEEARAKLSSTIVLYEEIGLQADADRCSSVLHGIT